MEGGVPMLNCLLQHTLRSLCTCPDSSSASSKWVYAVFWRILPRNYPPPKWDYGGTALDRSKGNKRNWILVWEDGFCDFHECENAGSGYLKGRFGADVFFKMSHEVYNYGEGLVGKVAADNSHKWVFKETQNETDPNPISSWIMSIEPQPRAWEFQFNSGIQTIAIISAREGIIQLGSFDKIVEDLNFVITIQRKFSYLQSMPGVFAIQRPYLPIQHPYILKPNNQVLENQELAFSAEDDKRQITGLKRLLAERFDDSILTKPINLGWNSPQIGNMLGPPIWSIPPLLPSMSCSLGALLSKLPSVSLPCSNNPDTALMKRNCNNNSTSKRVKADNSQLPADTKLESSPCHSGCPRAEKPNSINPNLNLGGDGTGGFAPVREGEAAALNLN